MLYFYHLDHLGSTSYITDKNGEVSQHEEYIPFGESLVSEHRNDKLNAPWKFNGKELDADTGFYYYGARFYSPRESLWLSVDPLAEKYWGRSPYEYCLSNPVNLVDPTGMEADGWGQKEDGTWEYNKNATKDNYKSENFGYKDYREDGSILENAKIGNGPVGRVYLGYGYNDFSYVHDDYMGLNNYFGQIKNDYLQGYYNSFQSNTTGNTFEGYVAKGFIKGSGLWGLVKGSAQARLFGASGNAFRGPYAISYGAEASAISGSAGYTLGGTYLSYAQSASGSLFSASGNLEGGWFTGQKGIYGLKSGVGGNINVVEGKINTSCNILGMSVKMSVGASVGYGKAFSFGTYRDINTGTINVNVSANIVQILGGQGAVDIAIPSRWFGY